jgi:hypothetical protein
MRTVGSSSSWVCIVIEANKIKGAFSKEPITRRRNSATPAIRFFGQFLGK